MEQKAKKEWQLQSQKPYLARPQQRAATYGFKWLDNKA